MTIHAQLAAAAHLGMLTGAADRLGALEEAARLVGNLMRSEAAALVQVSDNGDGRILSSLGYDAVAANALSIEFPHTPWMAMVATAPLPPSLSTESERTYRDGWFYQERLAPSGFRDGITGALRDQTGHLRGIVHASSDRPNRYREAQQRDLMAVLGALSLLVERALPATALPPATDRVGRVARSLPNGQELSCWTRRRTGWSRIRLTNTHVESRGTDTVLPYGLTARELEVLTALAVSLSDTEIAGLLHLSPRTIHTHVEHVRRKLGVPSRTAAAALALREGLLCVRLDLPVDQLVQSLARDR